MAIDSSNVVPDADGDDTTQASEGSSSLTELDLPPVPRYSHPVRRRARQARRLAAGGIAAIRAGRFPRLTKAFWWDGHPNFGDSLTPWLLQRHGMVPYLRSATQADLIGVGSILEMVPLDSTAAIWGSGLMYEQVRALDHASPLAVRGPITRDLLGLPGYTPLGDPGLLVSRYIRRPHATGVVAAVPHGHHAVWASAYDNLIARPGVQRVRFDRSVGEVAGAIASAELVVSSSLHGLITADSFGVPAVWAVPTDTDRHVAEMKFTDYHKALGISRPRFELAANTTVEELRTAAVTADVDRVTSLGDGLVSALLSFRDT